MADDPYASFSAPADTASGADPYAAFATAAPAAPTPNTSIPPQGVGNVLQNFVADWKQRADEGNAALHQYVDQANHPTAGSMVAHAMGLPTLNDAKGAAAALGVATAPIMAGLTTFTRPIAMGANAAKDAAGIAPGYEVDPGKLADVASIAVPFADALGADRALVQAAAKAGMSVPAYQAAQATRVAAANATRASSSAELVRAAQAKLGAIRDTILPGSNDASVQRLAAQRMQGAASNPAQAAEALGTATPEIVPGSKPTTFQLSGDMGLGDLERNTEGTNPIPFNDRRAAQNAARVKLLTSVQSGGNPNELAGAVRAHLDDLDAATQGDVDRATATQGANVAATQASGEAAAQSSLGAAQDAGAGIGGQTPPEVIGGTTRQAVREAEAAEKARFKGLYDAVDPDGTMVGNVAETRQAARQIAGEIPPTAKPMSGEEAAIFDTAGGMDTLSPFRDIQALRGRVAAEMRLQQLPTGDPQALRRLTMLKAAIQDNLANSISQKIANEAGAVQSGQVAAQDSTAARVQNWFNDWKAQREAEARAGGTADAAGPAGVGTPSGAGPDGAGLPTSGGPVSAPGNTGLPPDAQPIDPAAVERLNQTNAEYAAFKAKFGQAPISSVLARSGGDNLFKLPDARVAEKFFHPGPTGNTDMQALINTVGMDRAMAVIQEYAASSLRRAAMGADGTLDPRKYAKWVSDHQDALRALPDGIKTKFAGAADAAEQAGATAKSVAEANKVAAKTAQDTITEATRARNLALRSAKQGAVSDLMGLHDTDDVTKAIGSVLRSKGAVGEMRRLAGIAARDPVALQGLRQAVADFVVQKFIGNAEAATSGVNTIKADAFQTFMKESRQALATVFNKAELDNFGRIAADINRTKRSENAVKLPARSNTTQDIAGLKRLGERSPHVAKTLLEGLGATIGGFGGPVGAGLGYLGGNVLQSLRAAGIDRVDQLVAEALLNPEVARPLLSPPPVTPGIGAAMRLDRAVRAAAFADGATSQSREKKP